MSRLRDTDPSFQLSASGDTDPVPQARSVDVARRTRRYLINMAIRMTCLGLMLVVPGGWKLVMLIGAAVIPFLAVLWANDQEIVGKPRPAARWRSKGAAPNTVANDRQIASTSVPTLVLLPDGTYAEPGDETGDRS